MLRKCRTCRQPGHNRRNCIGGAVLFSKGQTSDDDGESLPTDSDSEDEDKSNSNSSDNNHEVARSRRPVDEEHESSFEGFSDTTNEGPSGVVEYTDDDVDWEGLIDFDADLNDSNLKSQNASTEGQDMSANDNSEDSTPDPIQRRSPSIPSDSDDESEASDVVAEWAQSDDPNEAELLWRINKAPTPDARAWFRPYLTTHRQYKESNPVQAAEEAKKRLKFLIWKRPGAKQYLSKDRIDRIVGGVHDAGIHNSKIESILRRAKAPRPSSFSPLPTTPPRILSPPPLPLSASPLTMRTRGPPISTRLSSSPLSSPPPSPPPLSSPSAQLNRESVYAPPSPPTTRRSKRTIKPTLKEREKEAAVQRRQEGRRQEGRRQRPQSVAELVRSPVKKKGRTA